MKSENESYILRTLTLAQKGLGSVSPNPLVGCVIVQDGVIVAEGYHQKYGEAHAEVNAINNLPKEINPSDCTLYVNLEPCSHHGKTPPCSDLIIKKGFKKVVICNVDTNPLVGGKGIEKLRNAGIEVITGVCEKEGRELNKRFFTFHEKKRPYIILKWAQTADGFISKLPVPASREENKISGEASHKLVHQMRSEEDAILVGKNTVINDNPELTTRIVKGKNPIRVVLAEDLKTNGAYKIYNDAAKTIIFNSSIELSEGNVQWIKLNRNEDYLSKVLQQLFQLGIGSVLVEGGLITLESFINKGLWDEIHVFVNPNLQFKEGIKAPKIDLNTEYQLVGNDRMYTLYSNKTV